MDDILKFITDYLSQQDNHFDRDALKINKLFGQASARQYFRVHTPQINYIVMKMPQGFSSLAEEITKAKTGAPQEFPFLNIHRYLMEHGINVPAILTLNDSEGLMLLEDLGDTSLEMLVKNKDHSYFMLYYKNVIQFLTHVQKQTQDIFEAESCLAKFRSFDVDLLTWEFLHFLEYGIEDRLKIKVSSQERLKFEKASQLIANVIAEMPQGFVHRDFQSRNIMFHNFDFYLIDFQDALIGPVLYDLVALLRDSDSSFNANQIEELLKHYHDNLQSNHPYFNKLDCLKRDFHLIALQRKLKDTGRFQFIDTVKGNPNFLVHVPLSLEYVKATFDALLTQCPTLSSELKTAVQDIQSVCVEYVKELT